MMDFEIKRLSNDSVIDGFELETGILISPIVMTRRQWEERKIKTPFYVNVKNEAVLLVKQC